MTIQSFMSLAVGLEQCYEQNTFSNNILISRIPTETGEKIGYLPGNENKKIGPYMRGIMDNLSSLHATNESKNKPSGNKVKIINGTNNARFIIQ